MNSAVGDVLDAIKLWECASCGFQTVSRNPRIYAATHPCGKHAGLQVDLVRVTNLDGLTRGKFGVRVNERPDYVGREVGVMYDGEGKVIMSVEILKPDGSNDCRIFAPCAMASLREYR